MIHLREICMHPASCSLFTLLLAADTCMYLPGCGSIVGYPCLPVHADASTWVIWQSVCRRDCRIKASSMIFSTSRASSSTFDHTIIGFLSIDTTDYTYRFRCTHFTTSQPWNCTIVKTKYPLRVYRCIPMGFIRWILFL